MIPKAGAIARCSRGAVGMILYDNPQDVTYPDGNKGKAWVGIHLTDVIAPIGSPWSSRNPRVLVESILLLIKGINAC